MYEDAQEIFDYLPINKNRAEDEYISHLWTALMSLDSGGQEGLPFLIMPFHLLFMMSIQYKILRIFNYRKEKYLSAFLVFLPRDDQKELLNPASVYSIGLLEESKIINILKIAGVDVNTINLAKTLIKNRNDNLAHAKGGIERNLEQKIADYITVLKQIQPYFEKVNDEVAEKWLEEMGTGQDGVDYIELHLAEEYICPVDMNQGELKNLDKKLNEKI